MSFQIHAPYIFNNEYISKELIKDLVSNRQDEFSKMIDSYYDNAGALIFILENVGRLPLNANLSAFEKCARHSNENVRFLAVKNLGKTKSADYLDLYNWIMSTDNNTIVKREAVSSIGRISREVVIPSLILHLENEDPKIVCQAIRGLLPFKSNNDVETALKSLINHENEMVRAVIHKEFYAQNSVIEGIQKHVDSYDFLRNVVVEGDVRNTLAFVPNNSFHLTFTSPPYYNARDYSIYPSYEAYLDFLEEVFSEVYRVTKEGRFLIVNTSPVIVPRISRAHSSKRYPIPFDLHSRLTRIGWEFIDDIVWMKPEYSVKNRIGGFMQHRKPLAYKPNSVTEYLMVYRKKTDKLLDWNMRQYSNDIIEKSKVSDGFETTNVWQINPKSDKVHSAVFPEDLCKRVIEYYSYVGDLVFDPFGGSGTFGRTAKKMNRNFFLTEKDPAYFKYIQDGMNSLLFHDVKFFDLEEFKETIK